MPINFFDQSRIHHFFVCRLMNHGRKIKDKKKCQNIFFSVVFNNEKKSLIPIQKKKRENVNKIDEKQNLNEQSKVKEEKK